MNNMDRVTSPRPGSDEPVQALSLLEFCEQAAGTDAPIEAWVACTVIDKQAVLGEEQLTIIATGENAASAEIRCTLPDVIEYRLDARHQAEIPFDEMVGSTLAVRLRAVSGDLFQIVDVEPAWIKEEIRASNRACLRDLAESGLLAVQKSLPEPETISRVCLIVAEDDPAEQEAQSRLGRLGVGTTSELAEFDGGRGRISLTKALSRSRRRAIAGEVEVIMVIHTGPDRDGVYALHDNYVADLVCQMHVPVVIGLRRPPHGSLLHQVAFAAFDGAVEAIEAVEGLLRRVREDEVKQAHILRWNERILERMREREAAEARSQTA